MLSVILGETDNVMYGPAWFKFNYDTGWFEDELVKKMMQDIDKSRYVAGEYIESDVLGPIAPTALSGGLKTLICIYKNPDLIYDATSCCENCAKWLLEIGNTADITINLKYLMKFKEYEPFDILILNEDKRVHTNKEYVSTAIHYV